MTEQNPNTSPACEVTDEMVRVYLETNARYWHDVDQLPRTPITKWRQGTPQEATRVSMQAALAARPHAESFEQAWKRYEQQGYQYGEDALSNVRFGWNIAMQHNDLSERLHFELRAERARCDLLTEMLSQIYGLLNPPPFTHDGKMYQFNNPDPQQTLQRLSDLIRQIPDKLQQMKDNTNG